MLMIVFSEGTPDMLIINIPTLGLLACCQASEPNMEPQMPSLKVRRLHPVVGHVRVCSECTDVVVPSWLEFM